MTNISCEATKCSNTCCIVRFDNIANDVCHRNPAVRDVFTDAHY